MRKNTLSLIIAIILLCPALGFSQNNNFEIAKNLEILTTLYKELNTNYVDEVQPGKLIKTGIDAMLESLDPYTNYIPESEIEDYKFMTTGQYGGIGSLIHRQGDYVIISEPYAGFPAVKAGLKAGDKIIAINGKSAEGKTTEEISNVLKGQPGSSMEIEIEREGKQHDFEIIRETIKIDNVSYFGMIDDKIGYIKLTGFTQNAWKEVKNALVDLKKNTGLQGLIIDLRGNGGGLLTESVNITNLFVDKGELIVSTKGKLQDKNKVYKTQFYPIDTEIPIAVLVNSGSASASEILSGAIQDLDRGIIIGKRTYGKGLVQNVVSLSYNAKAKLTVAKYYIPSGRCIQAIDYSHRNEDGSVSKIPDSLINEFRTKNNRLVYDGGGIEPDIKLKSEMMSNIGFSLFTKFLIFDYATKFASENDSILPADKFVITDEIYADFVEFLADKNYEYTTESEKSLNDLKKYAKKEKYFDAIQEDYQVLMDKIKHDKGEDLYEFQAEIKDLLQMEIAGRYYYQQGKIMAAIQNDPEIKEAVKILNNKDEYESVLKPATDTVSKD
jgi:carboxyl-terminal processing protease